MKVVYFWLAAVVLALGAAASDNAASLREYRDGESLRRAGVAAPLAAGKVAVRRPLGEAYVAAGRGYFESLLADEVGLAAFDEFLQARARDAFIARANGGGGRDVLGVSQWLADNETMLRELPRQLAYDVADDWTDYLIAEGSAAGERLRFVRELNVDYHSELGGRKWSGGVSALGALRETQADVVAWQLRGYAADASIGANAGLIYRFIPQGANHLLGANAFFDYEDGDYGSFYRWSFGAEARSAWVDVFANLYNPISDSVALGDGGTAYTKAGHDLAVQLHAPSGSSSFRWARGLTGGLTYYNWQGEFGDEDDNGIRYFVAANMEELPLAIEGLQVYLAFDSGGDDDASSFGGGFSFRHQINAADSGIAARADSSFNPREYFYAPVVREYAQRIGVREQLIDSEVQIAVDADSVSWWSQAHGDNIPIAATSTVTFPFAQTITLATNTQGRAAFTRGGAFEMYLNPQGNIFTTLEYRGEARELELLFGELEYRTTRHRTIDRILMAPYTLNIEGTQVSLEYQPNINSVVVQVNEGAVAIDIPMNVNITPILYPPEKIPGNEFGDEVTIRINQISVVVIGDISTTVTNEIVYNFEVRNTDNLGGDERYNQLTIFSANRASPTIIYVQANNISGEFATLRVGNDSGEQAASFSLLSVIRGDANLINLSDSGVLRGDGSGISDNMQIAVSMNLLGNLSLFYGVATVDIIPCNTNPNNTTHPNLVIEDVINTGAGAGIILPSYRGSVALASSDAPGWRRCRYPLQVQNGNLRFNQTDQSGFTDAAKQDIPNAFGVSLRNSEAEKEFHLINMRHMQLLPNNTPFYVTINILDVANDNAVVDSEVITFRTPPHAAASDHLHTQGKLLYIGAAADYEDNCAEYDEYEPEIDLECNNASVARDAEREIWHLDDSNPSASNWTWGRWGNLHDDVSATTNAAVANGDRFMVQPAPLVHNGTMFLLGGAADDDKTDNPAFRARRIFYNPHVNDSGNFALLSNKSEWEVLDTFTGAGSAGHPIDRVGGALVPCTANGSEVLLRIGGSYNGYSGRSANNGQNGDVWYSSDGVSWQYRGVDRRVGQGMHRSQSVGEFMDAAVINNTVYVRVIDRDNSRIYYSGNCGQSAWQWTTIPNNTSERGSSEVRMRTRMVAYQGYLVLVGGAETTNGGNDERREREARDTLWYAAPHQLPEGNSSGIWNWYRGTLPDDVHTFAPAVGVYDGYFYVVGDHNQDLTNEAGYQRVSARTKDFITWENIDRESMRFTQRGHLIVVPQN